MDISIIIVSWNVRDRLRECLSSIPASVRDSKFVYEVLVVDNASSDGSVEMVRTEFPNVRVIASTENHGFAAANNQAIRAASRQPQAVSQSEFVLLLNPDMRVLPGTLEGIVRFMREPRNEKVGIAGCKLVDEHSAVVPHVRRFPTLRDQLAIILKLPHFFPRIVNQYLVHGFDYNREARVDSIRGSFFCVRRRMIESIGGLDESFFVWFEEVDYCMRARRSGWQIAYTPSVSCVDYVGQSFRQVAIYRKQKLFTQSMLRYFWKHRPRWEWAVLATVRPFVLGVVWATRGVRRKTRL